jgi:hypothetical protein
MLPKPYSGGGPRSGKLARKRSSPPKNVARPRRQPPGPSTSGAYVVVRCARAASAASASSAASSPRRAPAARIAPAPCAARGCLRAAQWRHAHVARPACWPRRSAPSFQQRWWLVSGKCQVVPLSARLPVEQPLERPINSSTASSTEASGAAASWRGSATATSSNNSSLDKGGRARRARSVLAPGTTRFPFSKSRVLDLLAVVRPTPPSTTR